MQSYIESLSAFQAGSSVPVIANTFPILRLPDEILSRVIDVGSWFDHNFNIAPHGHDWISDTKPCQKEFVRMVSRVCSRWREIARWRGYPHRWRMCLVLTFDEAAGAGPNVSRELSRFQLGLRASHGCDLLVRLFSWTRADYALDFDSDDPAAVNVQLFMHGIKMLVPYLPQIIALDVHATQSDPLQLLFSMLHRWPTTSRLTSLGVFYDGAATMRKRTKRSNPRPSECQLLNLKRHISDDYDELLHSLPTTLAHLDLECVSIPKSLALPSGMTRLAITENQDNTINFHSLIPRPSHLTFLHLDLRNTSAPSTALHLDGLLTLRVNIDLMSLLTWSRTTYAKSLQCFDVTVSQADTDMSVTLVDLPFPSQIVMSPPLLAPVHLNVRCSACTLPGILSCLAIQSIITLTVEFKDEEHDNHGMNVNLESLSLSKEIDLRQVRTLLLVTNGKQWCQTLECLSFPYLQSLSYTLHSSSTSAIEETQAFVDWLLFSSSHDRCSSFDNLVTLVMWLPKFDNAYSCHPFDYVPNIVELQIVIPFPPDMDWGRWMKSPLTHARHLPPLVSLRLLAVNLTLCRRKVRLEEKLERKIHDIQAGRIQHGVGLHRFCIHWTNETTEFRQNFRTELLQKHSIVRRISSPLLADPESGRIGS